MEGGVECVVSITFQGLVDDFLHGTVDFPSDSIWQLNFIAHG